MSNILDIFQDKSLKNLVSALRENPEFKEATKIAMSYDDREELPDSSFAWPEKRAFPIHQKKMAMLSVLYRTQFPPELYERPIQVPAHVDANLEKAAYLYDFKIPEQKKRPVVKVASITEDDYLLPSLKRFPVRNSHEAKSVMGILVKNAHVMGYDHLTEASDNLIKKMASLGMESKDVHPTIYKYAGLTQSDKSLLEASILRRTDFIKDQTTAEPYKKLAEIVDNMDFNRHNLLKVASTLEKLDKEADVRRLYDKHIPNPMETVFNTNLVYNTQKTAGHGMFTPEMAEMVTEGQVRNLLGEDILQESLSSDKVLDRGKLAEVVNSLPTDMINDFIERIA